MASGRRAIARVLLGAVALPCAAGDCAPPVSFSDHTENAGIDVAHGFEAPLVDRSPFAAVTGGVAAGDYDGDGFVDLYVVGGDAEPNALLRNLGDGRFEEVAQAAGVDREGDLGAGPAFVDYDGDGHLDLFVGGAGDTVPRVFRGLGDGTFEEPVFTGLVLTRLTQIGSAFADYDLDGDLDLYVSHWGTPIPTGLDQQLWRNEGDGTFVDATEVSGIALTLPRDSPVFPVDQVQLDLTFGPAFADIDDDGRPDLLVTADFHTSHVLRNVGDGRFEDVTTEVIDDENGMGSAVGDFDNDCDLDWFVTSIWSETGGPAPGQGYWGTTGNRLYRNDGAGVFEDVSESAGVRDGGWGWGACFADFDNDGHLDVFHVNGWYEGEGYVGVGYDEDPSRLFMSRGDGTFAERAFAAGIDDRAMGRGVACFDMERDGDVDIFIANIDGSARLLRNELIEGGGAPSFLNVRLRGPAPNTQGIGARVFLRTRSGVQMREIAAGSRFASQDPAEAHFGLGSDRRVRSLEVWWPDGARSVVRGVRAGTSIVVDHAETAVRGAAPVLLRDTRGCPSGR